MSDAKPINRDKVKNCPFCGQKPYIGQYIIKCESCVINVTHQYYEELGRHMPASYGWNTRDGIAPKEGEY